MHKPLSFPPFRRIRERPDFQKVFRKGKRLYSSVFILYYRLNEFSYSRMGAVTSKKNVRRAVQRNKIKRVAREVFRHHQKDLISIDIVLVAKKNASEASKDELRECLEKLIKKLV